MILSNLRACSLVTGLLVFASAAANANNPAEVLFELKPVQDRQAIMAQMATDGFTRAQLESPATVDIRLVDVKPERVSADNKTLAIPLTDGRTVQFNLLESSHPDPSTVEWVGDVPSDRKQKFPSANEVRMDPFNWLVLVRDGSKVAGEIHVGGECYRLISIGNGQQVLIRVDESKLPPEAPPISQPVVAEAESRPDNAGRTSHSTIRVMFVLTKQAAASGSFELVNLKAAVATANRYLENSQVDVTFQMSNVLYSDYDETGKTYQEQLNDMSPTQPLGAEIHVDRERFKADMVTLVSTVNNVCGVARLSIKKTNAFSLISCTGSLAHEWGHNLGSLHHRGEVTPSLPPYAYGYESQSPKFHTQMKTSHGAIPYFANPRLQYQGVPMGTVEFNDVARRLNEYREAVENFYPEP